MKSPKKACMMYVVDNDALREFLLVVRQALLMIVRWIERRYHLKSE